MQTSDECLDYNVLNWKPGKQCEWNGRAYFWAIEARHHIWSHSARVSNRITNKHSFFTMFWSVRRQDISFLLLLLFMLGRKLKWTILFTRSKHNYQIRFSSMPKWASDSCVERLFGNFELLKFFVTFTNWEIFNCNSVASLLESNRYELIKNE